MYYIHMYVKGDRIKIRKGEKNKNKITQQPKHMFSE